MDAIASEGEDGRRTVNQCRFTLASQFGGAAH
jgi:hypothetical protein